MFDIKNAKTAREAAFFSLCLSDKLSKSLQIWKQAHNPSAKDFHLAEMIAYGTCKKALTLDYIAKELTQKKKLNIKSREKILLQTALFQALYLDKVPLFAINSETVELAKRHFNPFFAKFINALLRNLEKGTPPLPQSDSLQDLSIRYSYPLYFVEELVGQWGLEKAKEWMEILNINYPVHYRDRESNKMHVLQPGQEISSVSSSSKYYIQNSTPWDLIAYLKEGFYPKTILDLCASPGGKLIALRDVYKQAALFANDVSDDRLEKLYQNLEKYGIKAEVSCSLGQDFSSSAKFDLVVLDVPCSNSGVLHKRPEARWRLGKKELEQLKSLQLALFEKALSIVAPGGQIWYMTCSILKEENEFFVKEACKRWGLKVIKECFHFPNREGWDGGYGASLSVI